MTSCITPSFINPNPVMWWKFLNFCHKISSIIQWSQFYFLHDIQWILKLEHQLYAKFGYTFHVDVSMDSPSRLQWKETHDAHLIFYDQDICYVSLEIHHQSLQTSCKFDVDICMCLLTSYPDPAVSNNSPTDFRGTCSLSTWFSRHDLNLRTRMHHPRTQPCIRICIRVRTPLQSTVCSHVYLRLPLFTRVYLCLQLFTHACLPLFTHVYSCLLMITLFYICLPPYTRVYLWLPMFTPVYSCLHMFTGVYLCLPLFTCLLVINYV